MSGKRELKRSSTAPGAAAVRAAMASSIRAGKLQRARSAVTKASVTKALLSMSESKFHDLDIDDTTIAAGGTLAQASCNLIAQGVTESTRVGRKATITQIGWRFDVAYRPIAATDIGSTVQGDVVRVILFLDKQNNGSAGGAAVTDLLETSDYQSFNNLANKGRFKVLMDRTYPMTPSLAVGDVTSADVGGYSVADSFYKEVRIPIEFSSTTGAITEITSNNLGVITLSKSGFCSFSSKMRLRFTDM